MRKRDKLKAIQEANKRVLGENLENNEKLTNQLDRLQNIKTGMLNINNLETGEEKEYDFTGGERGKFVNPEDENDWDSIAEDFYSQTDPWEEHPEASGSTAGDLIAYLKENYNPPIKKQ